MWDLHAEPRRSSISHRPEIDGLRAIAVLAVFCFHSTLIPLPGGFVGVDVFFVISGYLIGRQVVEAVRAKTFSMLDFYERRARRLAAPLLLVVCTTYVASLCLLMPDDLLRLSRSVIATLFLAANFHFFGTIDYFNADDFLVPLLHLWSLAVEEQFYLAFPLLVIVCVKIGTMRPLLAIGLASLAVCIYVTGRDQAAAFFLPQYRMWELLCGLCVFLAEERWEPTREMREAISAAGLLMIGTATLAFDAYTPFPGIAATLPCIGTSLVIYANHRTQTTAGAVLAKRPLVGLGRISYALYLWHWPAIVLVQYYLDRKITPTESLLILIVCIGLSLLTLQLVEGPIRRKRTRYFRGEMIVGTACMSAILALAVLPAIWTSGLPWRVPNASVAYAQGRYDWTDEQTRCVDRAPAAIRARDICTFGSGPKVLLWGDSHATAVLPALKAAAAELGYSVTFVGTNGCPPLVGLETEKGNCLLTNRAVTERLLEEKFAYVFVAANWASYGSDNVVTQGEERLSITDTALPRSLRSSLEHISSGGSSPVLVGQTPSYKVDVPAHLAKVHFLSKLDRLLTYRREAGSPSPDPQYLRAIAHEGGLRVIWPRDHLCGDAGPCKLAERGRSLYKDGGHLSAFGSMSVLSAPLRELLAVDKSRRGRYSPRDQ